MINYNFKIKWDLPVSWSLIMILWLSSALALVSEIRQRSAKILLWSIHQKNIRLHLKFYMWCKVVRALTSASAEVSHKIIIKLQVTGKSRLILKFYFLTFCISIANETSKSKCNLMFILFLGISIKETSYLLERM